MTAVTGAEVIATERLVLRPLRVEHAQEMAGVLSDPELYAFTGGEPPAPHALRSRYGRWAAGSPDPAVSWCNWVVESRDDSRLTGTVQATLTRQDDGRYVAEIAWVIGTAWQGRGFAKEAARGLLTWLRRQPVTEVVAHVHPQHGASAAVATAAGLTRTDRWHDGEVRWQRTVRTAQLDELRSRRPMDLEAYEARTRQGPCFVCAFVAGDPEYVHERVFEDEDHVAFLDRYPTLPGKVVVAPKQHIEHVVRDLDEAACLRLMTVVRRVALAVEDVLAPELTYLLSLGSRQGNAHLHWHIAGLPEGVPYGQQQYHALMTENGVLARTPQEAADMAARLREAVAVR